MLNDVRSKVVLGLDVNEFRRGISQVDASIKRMSGGMSTLGKAIGASFVVSKVASFTSEIIKLGSETTQVREGFKRFGNESDLQAMRESTRGLVTDLELMKTAVKAGNFGIPIKEMGTLLEFAQRRAAETGEDVDYLVNSIVTGIGRKSPMILDNLGISTSRLKDEFHGAAIEAQSIADVTAAVGKIAEEELDKMGPASETASQAIDRLAVSWENAKASAGEAAAKAFEKPLVALADGLDYMAAGGGVNEAYQDILKIREELKKQPELLAQIEAANIYGQWNTELKSLRAEMEQENALLKEQEELTALIAQNVETMGRGYGAFMPDLNLAMSASPNIGRAQTVDQLGATGSILYIDQTQANAQLEQIAKDRKKALDKSQEDLKAYYEWLNQTVENQLALERQYNQETLKTFERGFQRDIGFLPDLEEIDLMENSFVPLIEKVADKFGAATAAAQEFGDILRASFEASLVNGENFFEVFKDGVKNYIKQILAMTAATTALAVAIAFVTGGANFKKAFNVVGGAMGTPFGFGSSGEFGLKGRDFFFAMQRNGGDLARNGG